MAGVWTTECGEATIVRNGSKIVAHFPDHPPVAGIMCEKHVQLDYPMKFQPSPYPSGLVIGVVKADRIRWEASKPTEWLWKQRNLTGTWKCVEGFVEITQQADSVHCTGALNGNGTLNGSTLKMNLGAGDEVASVQGGAIRWDNRSPWEWALALPAEHHGGYPPAPEDSNSVTAWTAGSQVARNPPFKPPGFTAAPVTLPTPPAAAGYAQPGYAPPAHQYPPPGGYAPPPQPPMGYAQPPGGGYAQQYAQPPPAAGYPPASGYPYPGAAPPGGVTPGYPTDPTNPYPGSTGYPPAAPPGYAQPNPYPGAAPNPYPGVTPNPYPGAANPYPGAPPANPYPPAGAPLGYPQ